MPEIKVSKSYVRQDKTAVITCPYCKRQRELSVSSLKEHKSQFRIKCACQNVFIAQIEFRQRLRKRTYLRGTYTNLSRGKLSGEMVVRDLSVSGLGMTTYDMENFEVGDKVMVEFHLDDDRYTDISREVVVMQVRKNSIGCEFTEFGNIALDGPLGTFLAKI